MLRVATMNLSVRRFGTLAPTTAPKLSILFGSQTGKATAFSFELRKAARKQKLKFDAVVTDLAEFDPKKLSDSGLCVFMTSCFGHGEPTDNARTFYQWVMDPARENEKDLFAKTHYCVFGLGQKKTYPERYQQVSREIDARLKALGAVQVLPRGEGDDSNDIESDYEVWSEQFFSSFEKMQKEQPDMFVQIFGCNPSTPKPAAVSSSTTQTSSSTSSSASSSNPFVSASATPSVASPVASAACSPKASTSSSSPCAARHIPEGEGNVATIRDPMFAPILMSRDLATSDANKSVIHMSFDSSKPSSKGAARCYYTTGDYLGIHPRSSWAEVKALAKRLNLDPHLSLEVSNHPALALSSSLLDSPQVTTVGTVLARHADLQNPPSRAVLKQLARFAEDKSEQDKLLFLSSLNKLAVEDYNHFVVRERRNFLEILHAFPSIRSIPVEELVEILPRMSPRYYSICSSSLLSPSTIEIVARIVDFVTPTGRHHRGLATRFLNEREEGDHVPMFVKQSLFRLPQDPQTPIIMCAGGTGIAPFRAFIQERRALKKQGHKVGANVLFFGCEHRAQDLLFEEELTDAVKSGDLLLFPAFSHDQGYRVFVQHKLLEESSRVFSLLSQGASFYCCGNAATLGGAVLEALTQIIEKEGGISYEQAQIKVKQMQEQHQFQLDVY